MEDTEPSNNALHKTKHAKSSILRYGIGLDPVAATFCLVGWIKRTHKLNY